MSPAPVITLKNSIVIANFSSPHPFTFDDGSILPACSPERARELMLEQHELEYKNLKWVDISLQFEMSWQVREEIAALQASTEIDIILVPFPVLEAYKREMGHPSNLRVCRVVDRVTKVISSERFCI